MKSIITLPSSFDEGNQASSKLLQRLLVWLGTKPVDIHTKTQVLRHKQLLPAYVFVFQAWGHSGWSPAEWADDQHWSCLRVSVLSASENHTTLGNRHWLGERGQGCMANQHLLPWQQLYCFSRAMLRRKGTERRIRALRYITPKFGGDNGHIPKLLGFFCIFNCWWGSCCHAWFEVRFQETTLSS